MILSISLAFDPTMDDIFKIKGAKQVEAVIPCTSSEEKVKLLGGIETIRVHLGLPSLALTNLFLVELYHKINDETIIQNVLKEIHPHPLPGLSSPPIRPIHLSHFVFQLVFINLEIYFD